MTQRAYRWHGDDPDTLARFAVPSVASSEEHKGICPCGADTTRNVTVGPPGHPRNGWECVACGERFMRAELAGESPSELPVKGEA